MHVSNMITDDMFAPIIQEITAMVGIGVTVGVGIFGVVWVTKKGFGIIKSMMNKAS